MSGVVHIEIQESVEELESFVRQQNNPRLKERLQALYMIKNQGLSVSASAKILGRHRSTVQRWLAGYRQTGIKGLLQFEVSPGRTKTIPNWAVESLKKKLEDPEMGFAGYKEIQQWLSQVLGIEAKYATIHHLVRYRLKAKLKVPRPKNCKQDQEKKEAFKKTWVTTYN
jgi:transposase